MTTSAVTDILKAWEQIIAAMVASQPPMAGKIRMWLNPEKVHPRGCAEGILDIDCPTALFQTQIRDNLTPLLIETVSLVCGLEVTEVRCRVSRAAVRDHAAHIEGHQAAPDAHHAPAFGNGYKTLADFVVGLCNRIAFSAIQRLLDDPRTSANPLFIHGAPGLGKTHLEQGLAVAFRERYPRANVLYLRCEQFTNEFLEACADPKHALRAFRVKMRHADLLLIDDIHWLSQGLKAKTKDELFATLEALQEQGKRVVISSDASPRDITYLEQRFVQRFSAGLVVALDRPDSQVRRDVVIHRAAVSGLPMSEDVVSWLVDHFTDNMRQLEGAVHKLDAFYRSFNRPIDLMAARTALSDLISTTNEMSPVDVVLTEVAERFAVQVRDLRGRGRSRELSKARQIALYILRHVTSDTYSAIGKHLGVSSHASVTYACQHAVSLRAGDPGLDAFIEDVIFRARRVQ